MRDENIKNERARGITYRVLAEKYKISIERVRQICARIDHVTAYNYSADSLIDKELDDLKLEIELASQVSKTRAAVLMRRALVRHMYDVLNLSFNQIGKMINRDRTSVMNLYYG